MTEVAAGTAADSTVLGAGSTGGQPDLRTLMDAAIKDAAEWKQRFSGMQGRYQQEHDSLLKAQAQMTDLTVSMQKITGDHGALESEVKTLSGSLAETKTAREKAEQALGRFTVLADFPNLLPLEAKGLLPAGVGDDFKAKLTALSETFKTAGINNALPDGGTKSAPNPAIKDRAALLAELRGYQSEGKTTEYDASYKALLDLDAAKK